MSALLRTHQFERRARDADSPEVRKRAEAVLELKLEAVAFHWTDRGSSADKAGIDVWAGLRNDKQVGVDVKDNRWGEVRLEYVSRLGEGIPGWTVDDGKRMDYVLNLWPGHYWLIDFPSLRAVAKANRDKYAKWYGHRASHSEGSSGAQWETRFIPVPVGILLADIYGQTVVGAPLTAARLCPACRLKHPVGTTCGSSWAEGGIE